MVVPEARLTTVLVRLLNLGIIRSIYISVRDTNLLVHAPQRYGKWLTVGSFEITAYLAQLPAAMTILSNE